MTLPLKKQVTNKETIEVIEIWMPVKEDGEVFSFSSQKNMKLIAYIVNGHPLKLEKDFMLEKRYITKEEANNLIKL